MTENQIEYLKRQIPAEWTSAVKDFEYYRDMLVKYDGQFIYTIADWTVSICKTDSQHFGERLEDERTRFTFLYSIDNLSNSLSYFVGQDTHDKYAYLWYDGHNGFHKVSKDEALKIYRDIATPWHRAIKAEYPEYTKAIIKGLDIDITCPEYFAEISSHNELVKGNLTDVLKRMSQWVRVAMNQKIVIGYDHCDKCFSFAEYVDGKCIMNGGIICSNNNHWSIHT